MAAAVCTEVGFQNDKRMGSAIAPYNKNAARSVADGGRRGESNPSRVSFAEGEAIPERSWLTDQLFHFVHNADRIDALVRILLPQTAAAFVVCAEMGIFGRQAAL